MSKKIEKIKEINEKIIKLNKLVQKYRENTDFQISNTLGTIDEKADLMKLLSIAEKSRVILKESGRELSALSFKKRDAAEETIKMLAFVKENRKWRDPYLEVNLLLEWAIYRAYWALGGRIPRGFGPVLNTDGSEPIHTASGLQPDVLVDFGDYCLIIESTISSGPRQYDTEAEPVIRHIARIIQENRKKGDLRPVYSVFVARELDPNVIEYFFIYHAFHKHPLAREYITVIPLTVEQFSVIFRNLMKEDVPGEKIRDIFERIQGIKSLRICKECGGPNLEANSWYKQVLNIISQRGLLHKSCKKIGYKKLTNY